MEEERRRQYSHQRSTNASEFHALKKAVKRKIRRRMKKHIEEIQQNPKLYVKSKLSGGLAAILMVGLGMGVLDMTTEKYQVVEFPPPYTETGEMQTGLAYAKWSSENEFKKNVFTQNVTVIDADGNEYRIKAAQLSALSDAFSKKELEEYQQIYQVIIKSELTNKMGNKVKATLPAGSYVAGKSEPDSEDMISVITDDGRKGKIVASNLEKIISRPDQGPLQPTEQEGIQAKPLSNITGNQIEFTGSTYANDFTVINGEVMGIDVNTSGVKMDVLRELLDGSRKLNTVGNITNTQINYIIIKMGGFYWETEDHRNVWGQEEYDEYMEKIIDIIDLCKEFHIPYGFYFYSTAINEQEAAEEARDINRKLTFLRERGVDPPAIPLALDVEMGVSNKYTDRQLKASDNIEEASIARAQIFNEVLREHGDYTSMMIYTNQNVTVQDGCFLDLSTMLDHITVMDTLPIWWVSQYGVKSAEQSGKEMDGTITPQGKTLKIVGKQIVLDEQVEGSFLVDKDVFSEEYFFELLHKNQVRTLNQEELNTERG